MFKDENERRIYRAIERGVVDLIVLNAGYVLGRNKQLLESGARWGQSTIVGIGRNLQDRNEAKPEGGAERGQGRKKEKGRRGRVRGGKLESTDETHAVLVCV